MTQKYKNILVTGANSLLGTNLLAVYAAQGVRVRALVRRSNADLDRWAAEGLLELCMGNVSDPADLRRAMAGCDAVVHIAAITDQALPRYAMYRDFNVGGLQKVVEAMRAVGVGRLVFVSSANTVGNGTLRAPANESCPPAAPFSTMYYGRSKVEAERYLASVGDIDWTVVCPTFMLGAYDSKPSSGQLIVMGYGKRVVFSTPGGKNFVSVSAAAEALACSVERGRRGERYLLGGVNMSLRDFFKLLNPRATVVVVPSFLLVAAGAVGNVLRWLGVHTPLSVDNLRVVCTKEYYTAEKARQELGLRDTEVRACIDEAVGWFRERGMLKK